MAVRKQTDVTPRAALTRVFLLAFSLFSLPHAWASAATATTLSITVNGVPVTNVQPETVVTLTATVSAGSTAVMPGTVNFCDATVKYCTDIHLIGTAQLTSKGTAVYKFRPGGGIHSYKAVFAGTNTYTASSSAASSLTVPGGVTLLTATGAPGNYTLTAAVPGSSTTTPSGKVSFLDTTNANYLLGSNSLVAGPTGVGFLDTNPPTGRAPYYMAVGDFNGDGFPDLAITDYGAYSVTILLGNGDGTFTQGEVLSTAPYLATGVVAGDFNNDGKLDLAVVSEASSFVNPPNMIFLGNGDGTFAPRSGPSNGSYAYGVVVGDFNNDGNLDLAIPNEASIYSGPVVTVLLGNGDGTFTSVATQPTTGIASYSLTAGDFNGDGKTDLAVPSITGMIDIFLGNGDGTFTVGNSVLSDEGIFSLVTGDWNGDGKLDLAVSNEEGTNPILSVYLGNGDGTFSRVAVPLGTLYGQSDSVAYGDLNGDGVPDLVVADYGHDDVETFLGEGDGTFTLLATKPTTGLLPLSVVVDDLNGDGVPDLAVSNQNSNSVSIFLTLPKYYSTATITGVSVVGTGTHYAEATYPGDSNFPASVSNLVPLIATLEPTTATLTVSPANPYASEDVTLLATVTPDTAQNHTATGTVEFTSNGTTIATVPLAGNGTAAYVIPTVSAGTYQFSCTYSGDLNFAASSCNSVTTPVTAANYSLTLTSSQNPAPALTNVTFTASLSVNGQAAQAGQAITLTLNGQTINLTTNANGSATYAISTLIPGSYPVTANFAGTSSVQGASAALTEVITALQTVTSLTVSPNPAYVGQTVTMTANVTASGGVVNGGSVAFTDGGTTLGTQAVAGGSAMFAISTLAVGTHPITATYSPVNPDYLGSASTVVNEAILPSGFSVALSPSTIAIASGVTGTSTVQLTSFGLFAGPLALTYGGMPMYATPSLSPTSVNLGLNSTASATFTMKTLLKASNEMPRRPGSREVPMVFAAFALGLLPMARRRRLARVLFAMLAMIAVQSLVGCTNSYYTAEVVAPGTYQIPFTATDVNGSTQTATLVVIVTP